MPPKLPTGNRLVYPSVTSRRTVTGTASEEKVQELVHTLLWTDMSNTLRPARSIVRRLGVLTAAAGILATSLAAGSGASAQSPDDFGGKFPGAPIPIDPIIIDDGIKLPTIPKLPAFPLPCFGWWCDIPLQPLPDYTTSYDYISSSNSWFEGQKAVPYYVTIHNIGAGNPGAVWSTFASQDGEILGITAARPDFQAERVSDTARWSAPFATSYLDDAWVVADTDGMDTGYANRMYVQVWMAGWDRPSLTVSANEHVGVDQLGALTPANYRHNEVTRTNNRITFTL